VFPNFTNDVNPDVENQNIVGLEFGYGFRGKAFSANFNVYSTEWNNRQINRSFNVDGVPGTANFAGVGQLHQGVELDFSVSPFEKLMINGMGSVGNWRYTDDFRATVFDDDQNSLGDRFLYVKDVKVGDAAQTTFSLSAEYELIRNLSISVTYYHAEDLFADFNIGSDVSILTAGNEAWKLPAYDLVDAGVSYKFKLSDVNLTWRLNVNNVLDEEYISESDTNILYRADLDTREIGTSGSPNNRVFYGFGITWNTSLKVSF
jgi:outer membrane receptor protein involved in Fe transport